MIQGIERYNATGASTLCMGVFDGVHKGHRCVLKGVEFMVTFDPHPNDVIHGVVTPRLTTPDEQRVFFKNQLIIPFNTTLANMPPEGFLDTVIGAQLAPSRMVVGYDFRFGRDGRGTLDQLRAWGQINRCQVDVIPKQIHESGIPYKSSVIRTHIQDQPDHAIAMLGHPYLMIGTVIHGDKRGRDLGFPTVNLRVPSNKCMPKHGVYKSHVMVRNRCYNSISYIGRKPSFNGTPTIEAHILDGFDATIYDETVYLFLTQFIRSGRRFSTPDALIRQIQADIQSCEFGAPPFVDYDTGIT